MTEEEQNAAFDRWLNGRPAVIQELARRIPWHSRIKADGEVLFVVGYQESQYGAGLLVSEIDPAQNYQAAVDSRVGLCPCCVDKLVVEEKP